MEHLETATTSLVLPRACAYVVACVVGRSVRDAGPWSVLLTFAGLASFGALLFAYWPFTVDDAFILLRYAENIATGIGPTWNPGGPHAEGYTSPLWVALLAIVHAIAPDPLLFGKAMGVVAMSAALALAARLAYVLAAPRPDRERILASAATLFVLGTSPATAIHAVSGMETALATLLAVAWALAASAVQDAPGPGRAAAFAILALLLGLTRPELNLLVLVGSAIALAGLASPERRQLAAFLATLYVLPGALYFAWRLAYYGRWFPLPFYVKAVLPDGPLPGAGEAVAFARAYSIDRPDLGLLLLLGIAAAGRRMAAALGGILAIWLFLFLPAHEMGYDFRYFEPLVPLLAATIAVGLVAARERIGRAALFAPAVFAIVTVFSIEPWLEASIAEKRDYGRGIERAHAALGRALHALRPRVSRPVLATLDCGAIAYYSRWTVIDTWGLNEPRIATTGRRDPEYVLAARPEVVVVVSARRDAFVPHFEHERALWDRARARGYEHVASYEFLPDYHLFVLTAPGSPVGPALAEPRWARDSARR